VTEFTEDWKEPQCILVVLAHPDDPEFFCGGTLARWARLGHQIHYCLLTRGDKGHSDRSLSNEQVGQIREVEQQCAAEVIGVKSVRFFRYGDGFLHPGDEPRRDVVRVIRELKPNILLTSDPTHFYFEDRYINHPDHRAAGEITLDAFFPAANSPFYFPELLAEGLEPHPVDEVWLTLPVDPTVTIDVSQDWQTRLNALLCHKSQIGDEAEFRKRMVTWHSEDSTDEAPRFEEQFRRFIFK
jgi:LmbE family N-acetylglucosaminyl deacetylase